MLTLTVGSFYSSQGKKLRDAIVKRVEEKRKTVLIVPEQQTVIMEKEMALLLPPDSPLCFEVTNFSRLANTIFRSLGGIDKEYCDQTKEALLMWRALTELMPRLNMTGGRREVNFGTVSKALKAVSEADRLGIGIEELANAGKKITNKTLSGKVDDLVAIASLYKKLLSEKYANIGEDLVAAAEKLSKNKDIFADYEFFLDGFISFTEPQNTLLQRLISISDVSVFLAMPAANDGGIEYREPEQTQKRLIAAANRANVEVKIIRVRDFDEKREALRLICDLFWRTEGKIDNYSLQYKSPVKIYEAATPFEACEFIISDIRRRVIDGASYSDFAVISGDITKYNGILDGQAKTAEVPLFISAKRDISSFEAVKLIYTALSVALSNFAMDDVITYSKCSLSGLTQNERDIFELYVVRWQISGQRFYDGIAWNMNPDGYGAKKNEKTARTLLTLNEIRKKLISPLMQLKESFDECETVTDFAKALYSFLESISLYEGIKKLTSEHKRLGEAELAIENEALYKVIIDSLDTLVSVSGNEKCDTEGFISQLKIVFSAASVSKIPTFVDSVTVGSASNVRLNAKKHIYMLGVNKGEFPSSVKDDSFFSDRDKALLNESGLIYEPDTIKKESRELYSFSRAFSYAEESVDFIYSLKSADFSALEKSDIIERLQEITEGALSPIRIHDIPAIDRIHSKSDALNLLGTLSGEEYNAVREALISFGLSDYVRISERMIENSNLSLSDSALSLIYGDTLSLSQSKIDLYNTCPLAYFCRYILKLSENEIAEFNARNIGLFVHSILENFFLIARQSNVSHDTLSDERIEELVRKAAEMYLAESADDDGTKRTELLTERLISSVIPIVDGLCREFSDCGYQPTFFELKIGALPSPVESLLIDEGENKSVVIGGSVDRIDVYKLNDKAYLRVVDYKSGTKTFSPNDIEKGKNLQMFLYLMAISESKRDSFRTNPALLGANELIPGGVIYVKTDLSDVKISHASTEQAKEELKKSQKRMGMILDDQDNIGAMNPAFLPLRFGIKGPYKNDANKLYTQQGWEKIKQTVTNAVIDVSKRMRSGYISAIPMIEKNYSPCNSCKFKAFCRNAKIK